LDAGHVFERGHHGNEDAQRSLSGSNREGLHLILEQVGVVKENAYGSVAMEGARGCSHVGGRYELVASQIEEAKCDRTFGKRVIRFSVDFDLLVARRESLSHDEGKFRAVETDALGAVFLGQGDVDTERHVGLQTNAHAVRGLRRSFAVPKELRAAAL